MGSMEFDWGRLIVGQLEFYWDVHLRPRLDGLTDEEYLWEPVKEAWNLRRQPDGTFGADGHLGDDAPLDRDKPPVTTIAWRMMHLAANCFWNRYQAFFGDQDAPADLDMFDPRFLPADLPGTAAGGTAFLEDAYRRWHRSIAALDEATLREPLGVRGGPYAEDSMAALIVHISREAMHHGGEIGALRDLYRAGVR
jgi:hypothetical protein